jgi:hypothetical protein
MAIIGSPDLGTHDSRQLGDFWKQDILQVGVETLGPKGEAKFCGVFVARLDPREKQAFSLKTSVRDNSK